MPKRYRKKPVVIDAVQTDGEWETVQHWLISLGYSGDSYDPFTRKRGYPKMWVKNTDGELSIETLEGDDQTAAVGDWLIRGVQGEFYPCKPDIFAETYEPETPDA